MQQFRADASRKRRYAPALKVTLRSGATLLFVIFNLWLGHIERRIGWGLLGFLGLLYAVIAAAMRARLTWGDMLELQGDTLIVSHQGRPVRTIVRGSVYELRVKPEMLMLCWHAEDKKRAIMIGAECFTAPVWAALQAALSTFDAMAADEATAISQVN